MPQLDADKKELEKSVTLAMLASGRNCKDAALQNVLLRVEGGQGSVESYDNHIFSKSVFPAKGDSGLEFAIEGARLEHLIAAADEGNVTFTVEADGVKVSFGRATIQLRTFPVDKYVRMQASGVKSVAKDVRAGLLLKALEFVRPFIGKDTQQPTRMLAELRNGRFLAGDGVRIGVVKFGGPGEAAEEGAEAVPVEPLNFPLKVPQAVISNVTRWLKGQVEGEEEGLINIDETEDFYFLKTSKGAIFAWRKPEHEFMAIEQYLDKFEDQDGAAVFKVDKESLQRMVDALSVVLEAGAEKVTFGVNGSAMMPMLQGTAFDSRGVPSSNQVQIVVNGPKMDGDFSIRYSHLLDTLKLLSQPVVTCNVRKESSILQVIEAQPEMTMTSLLTLMAEA